MNNNMNNNGMNANNNQNTVPEKIKKNILTININDIIL